MNFKRGFGRILEVLISIPLCLVWAIVAVPAYIWTGFFGPPDEAPKQEWHWQ